MTAILTLVGLALCLFIAEIFIPGGLLAIGGAFLLILAGGLSFYYGVTTGLLVLVGSLILVGVVFFIEFRLLKSRTARRLFTLDDAIQASTGLKDTAPLVGQAGVALTIMAPTGKVGINGRSYDAAARDGYLPKGARVVVVSADSFRLLVTQQS